jgi:glycosyltransferase involved in cell wall biosynthesis
MSVNVVDLTGNHGGGTRFVRALLPALLRARPGLEITFLTTEEGLVRNDAVTDLRAAGVKTRALTIVDGMNWYAQPFAQRLRYRLRHWMRLEPDRRAYMRMQFQREVDGADITYFPWPYLLPVPRLRSPMVMTVHDLNFMYFFGTPIFGSDATRTMTEQMRSWLSATSAVTSSQFMADEIRKFYPDCGRVPVIRLAPFSDPVGAPGSPEPQLPERVQSPYVLSANNVTQHKNLGAAIAAQAILRQKFPDIRLVMAGVGTEASTGRATAIGTARTEEDADVIGLGYVSNDEINRLIDGAAAVINTSLYEAGNGPGLDAWSRGTPVAMSNIPPFVEHLPALGVEAALFDPRNPADIAAKVADIIDNGDRWREVANRSRAAIQAHTWDRVASDYLSVFDASLAAVSGE